MRRARKIPMSRRSPDHRIISDYMPPEGVPIRFEVASLGARIAAQLTDILLTMALVLAIIVFLSFSQLMSGEALSTLASILFFALRVPYYLFSEMLWNGQTLGKKLTGLRVISSDGRSLSPHAVTIRNLMKEMEVFVPGAYLLAAPFLGWPMRLMLFVWIMILLIVPLMNKRRQRLGDIIANTYVVYIPKPVLLPDPARTVTARAVRERYSFLPHHLDHYGRYELQTLETLLQVKPERLPVDALIRHRETVAKVGLAIAKRIEFTDRIRPGDERGFLQEFYRTQRAYLENRKLFGDAREDKFHREPTPH